MGEDKPQKADIVSGKGIHRGALAKLLESLGRVPVTNRMARELPPEVLDKLISPPVPLAGDPLDDMTEATVIPLNPPKQ